MPKVLSSLFQDLACRVNTVAKLSAVATLAFLLPAISHAQANQATVNISPTSRTLDAGSAITLTASGGSGTGAYTWGGEGSGTGTSKVATFFYPGNYTVTVFRAASSGFNVSNTATSNITVNIPQPFFSSDYSAPGGYVDSDQSQQSTYTQARIAFATNDAAGGSIVGSASDVYGAILSGGINQGVLEYAQYDWESRGPGPEYNGGRMIVYRTNVTTNPGYTFTGLTVTVQYIRPADMTVGIGAGRVIWTTTGGKVWAYIEDDYTGDDSSYVMAQEIGPAYTSFRYAANAAQNYVAVTGASPWYGGIPTVTIVANFISNSTPLVLTAASAQNYLATQTLSATGGPASGTITYSIVNSSASNRATIAGAVLTATSGTGWVDVQATKGATTSNTVRVTLAKIPQAALTLSTTAPHILNLTKTYTTSGGNSTATTTDTYTDTANGVLRQGTLTYKALRGFGTYTLNLTRAADDNYLARTDSYVIPLTADGADELAILNACSDRVTLRGLGGNSLLVNNLLFQTNSTTGNGTQYGLTITRSGTAIPGYISSIQAGGYTYTNTTGSNPVRQGPNGATRVGPFFLSELSSGDVSSLKGAATPIIITYTFTTPQTLALTVNTTLNGAVLQTLNRSMDISCADAYATATPAVHEFRLISDIRNYPHSPRPSVLRWNAGIPVDIQVLKTLTDPNGVVAARGLTAANADATLTGVGAIIDDFTIENVTVSKLSSNGTLNTVSATGLISIHSDLRSLIFTPPASNPKGYGLYYVTYEVKDKRSSSSFSLPSRLIIYDNELPVPDPMAGGALTRFTATLPSAVQIGDVTSVPVSTLQNVTRNDVLPDGTTINGLSAYYILRTTACFFVHGSSAKSANMFITNMGALVGETTSSSLTNCGTVTATAYSPNNTSTNGFAACLNGQSFYYTRLPVTISVQNYTPASNFAAEIGKRVVIAASGSVKCVRIACP